MNTPICSQMHQTQDGHDLKCRRYDQRSTRNSDSRGTFFHKMVPQSCNMKISSLTNKCILILMK